MRRFINEQIDDILDIMHLAETYVVDNGSDHFVLKETAKQYGIEQPNTVIYSYNCALIAEAKQIPGHEFIPIPVMNVFMEYGNNYIVSTFNLFFKITSLTLKKAFKTDVRDSSVTSRNYPHIHTVLTLIVVFAFFTGRNCIQICGNTSK